MPGEKGAYDLHEIVVWLRTTIWCRPGAVVGGPEQLQGKSLSRRTAEGRADLVEQQARKLRNENEEAEGKLLNADEVFGIWRDYQLIVRNQVMNLPSKLVYYLPSESKAVGLKQMQGDCILILRAAQDALHVAAAEPEEQEDEPTTNTA